MGSIRQTLVHYARLAVDRGLTAGPGGNVSAREGRRIWIKPTGFALDELTTRRLVAVDLETGKYRSPLPPTTELPMHLAIYRARPDVQAVFHLHPPWLCGILCTSVPFRHIVTETAADLGEVAVLPFILPGTLLLACRVAAAAQRHDTILLRHHGIVALGHSVRQAFQRAWLAESAAHVLAVAHIVGKPEFLNRKQLEDIRKAVLGSPRLQWLKSELAATSKSARAHRRIASPSTTPKLRSR